MVFELLQEAGEVITTFDMMIPMIALSFEASLFTSDGECGGIWGGIFRRMLK